MSNVVYLKWKEEMHIDYYAYFMKAWIPFNGWYSTNYPDLKDGEVISKLQREGNKVRDFISNSLNAPQNNNKANILKNYLSQLNRALELSNFNYENNNISLSNIYVEKNNFVSPIIVSRIKYFIKSENNKYSIYIESTITSKQFLKIEKKEYSLDDFQKAIADAVSQKKINATQEKIAIAHYKECAPYLYLNLTTDAEECIRVGDFKLINDSVTISKGIIRILYMLRNALMHGELEPDQTNYSIYREAYNIMEMISDIL